MRVHIMKCVRCGYCCYQYDVIIIKPEFCVPEFKMSEVKEFMVMHKKSGEKCPHLYFDGDIAVCKLHNFKWYKQTPCYTHNTEINNHLDCLLGTKVMNLGGFLQWKERIINA